MPYAPKANGAPDRCPAQPIRLDATLALAAGITLSVVASAPALAGENTQTPEVVTITARPPDPVGNKAYSTTLIDEQQLQVSDQLDSALRQVPGLSLFRRNTSLSANPTVQGVSLRSIGASGAGRALVTLDGVPQNDPFGSWVIWSSLPTEDIQGAEIVHGAGAGPYGAGALTGVIALTERTGTSGIIDAEGGELSQGRVAGAGNVQFDNVSIGASAMYQSVGGWVPVSLSQRGAADNHLTLKATSASIHGGVEVVPGTQVTGRFGYYNELRATGIVGASSSANGTTGSLTAASAEQPDAIGWRIQGWFRDSDMSNVTSAVGAKRATVTPAGNQYSVPALGWGGNAALRGTFDWLDWEAGVDARLADGESRELFSFTGGQFRSSRFAGGRTLVAGAYAEGASRVDDWLFTAGVRIDEWKNYNGHTVEHSLATGATTLNNQYADSSGTVPTGRAGVRKDLGDGLYLRSAAYEGFRAPSLNELYRAFRVGNNYTRANPALKPEKLYGVEAGIGDDQGAFTWDATAFWNKLADGVTNVTLANGPLTAPDVTLPAGGQLIQRQNVGYIRAFGAEGEAQWRFDDMLAVRGAFSVTDARVNGQSVTPQLTGKRPAQTPRMTLTAGLVANPLRDLTLEGDVRYETLRFSDDLNTLKLPAETTIDVKATVHLADRIDVYLAVDNLFNKQVATSEGNDGVFTIDAPRAIRIGLAYVYGP
ncbi:MAG TPA: TonB-dependent receptor [Micropepsaceae bacterium]|nr:TonB-dependent receptor [Micropepsaceae bacterium]